MEPQRIIFHMRLELAIHEFTIQGPSQKWKPDRVKFFKNIYEVLFLQGDFIFCFVKGFYVMQIKKGSHVGSDGVEANSSMENFPNLNKEKNYDGSQTNQREIFLFQIKKNMAAINSDSLRSKRGKIINQR